MTDLVLQALREIGPVTRGRNDTALSWGPVLAALAGRTRAVAYDRAGLGDSDPDPKSFLPNGPWLTCRD